MDLFCSGHHAPAYANKGNSYRSLRLQIQLKGPAYAYFLDFIEGNQDLGLYSRKESRR